MISVCMIVKNEENKISRALDCVKDLADEIIIVDSGSTDKTIRIAKKYGAKVYGHKFKTFAEQRNYAISKCSNEWILDIDADEIIPPETIKEITQVLNSSNLFTHYAYYIWREEYYLGEKVMEIKLIRLYRKSKCHYEGCVHEVLQVQDNDVGMLKGRMKHEQYLYVTVSSEMSKMNFYTDLELQKLESEMTLSRASTIWKITWEPIKWFFGFLLYKGTLRAGWVGVWEAYLAAHNQFLIYLKYYEKHHMGTQIRYNEFDKAILTLHERRKTK
jgi:glycosyltransferase involved in cell wall biosynthesis